MVLGYRYFLVPLNIDLKIFLNLTPVCNFKFLKFKPPLHWDQTQWESGEPVVVRDNSTVAAAKVNYESICH